MPLKTTLRLGHREDQHSDLLSTSGSSAYNAQCYIDRCAEIFTGKHAINSKMSKAVRQNEATHCKNVERKKDEPGWKSGMLGYSC
eukprot:scaffold144816_cov20-Prasinocladus_malaysianus.AAC.1